MPYNINIFLNYCSWACNTIHVRFHLSSCFWLINFIALQIAELAIRNAAKQPLVRLEQHSDINNNSLFCISQFSSCNAFQANIYIFGYNPSRRDARKFKSVVSLWRTFLDSCYIEGSILSFSTFSRNTDQGYYLSSFFYLLNIIW